MEYSARQSDDESGEKKTGNIKGYKVWSAAKEGERGRWLVG